MNQPITDAIVRNMQEGSSKSAHHVIKTCYEQGHPDFDDGAVLKEVFASQGFKNLVQDAVEKQIKQ